MPNEIDRWNAASIDKPKSERSEPFPALGGRGRDRHRAGAGLRREFDGGDADTPPGPAHEHGLARLKVRVREREVGDRRGAAERGGVDRR